MASLYLEPCRKFSISVPVIAPARPLKHRASVRDHVPLKARQDNGVQRFRRPGHGGELELLPGCSCDHTCAPPLLELPGTRIPPGELLSKAGFCAFCMGMLVAISWVFKVRQCLVCLTNNFFLTQGSQKFRELHPVSGNINPTPVILLLS